jgi:hypothetical protein
MFGSGAIDVAIGLAFFFALFSLVCSSLTETISQLLKWRAQTLERGIRSLLTDDAMRARFYAHPVIRSLHGDDSTGKSTPPSYIPARLFGLVVLDLLAPVDGAVPNDKSQVIATDLLKVLHTLTGTTADDIAAKRKSLETWFDDVMDRASGWYKRKVQWVLLALALVVSAAINADCVRMATSLWQDPTLRAVMVEAAKAYQSAAGNAQQNPPLDELKTRLETLKQAGFPLGWSGDPVFSDGQAKPWLSKIAGLLLTALAVSLGAPFWFDLVNRMVNVRSTGPVPPRATEAAQKEGQGDGASSA